MKESRIISIHEEEHPEELLKDMTKNLVDRMNLLQLLKIIDVSKEDHYDINNLHSTPKVKIEIRLK